MTLDILTAPTLKGVQHGFFTRRGGASSGIYAGLNCGPGSRDQAEAVSGAERWVPRDRLPPPRPGQYYWVDLEGLEVVTLEGVRLGTVSHLFDTGANPVMVVAGERERLLPFVMDQYVASVDLEGRRITVDWDPEF